MNEFLFFLEIVVVFGMVIALAKRYGKNGLYAWAAVAPIFANIFVPKNITLFGMDAAMGNVAFASMFLCTDILSEVFGEKDAKKAVNISLASMICFIAVVLIGMAFIPNANDFVQGSMETLFSFSLRITAASVIMFYLSNLLDVKLYNWLKKINEKNMWLRNNVCTIFCNCAENFGFMILAFIGVFTLQECLLLTLSGCIIEAIIGLCDTPFLYICKHMLESDKKEVKEYA